MIVFLAIGAANGGNNLPAPTANAAPTHVAPAPSTSGHVVYEVMAASRPAPSRT